MVSPNANRFEEQQPPSLPGRQRPLCNLSLDEGKNHQIGNARKPFNTTHLDELLQNVVSIAEGQLVQDHPSSSSYTSSSSSPASFATGNLSFNGTLSRTAADDVWNEIVHQEHANTVDNRSMSQNLEETTLENFLIHAGVISAGNQNGSLDQQPVMGIDPMIVGSQQADWFQIQMATVQQQQEQQQMAILEPSFHISKPAVYHNSVVDVGYSESQMAMSMPMPATSAVTSSESPAASEKKRRYSDEIMEKTIERRQKRMIKNRQSAARSRARKQAYTNHLESRVFQLTEKNNWLKKQKEMEILLSSEPTTVPKYQIRRTSSVPF